MSLRRRIDRLERRNALHCPEPQRPAVPFTDEERAGIVRAVYRRVSGIHLRDVPDYVKDAILSYERATSQAEPATRTAAVAAMIAALHQHRKDGFR